MSAPWWQTGVVYQVYPRSFLDTSGTGVGDLEGIRQRLDYLAWLGVDAVWLSPIYPSPMADFGYDVADHCDVDPMFGSLAGFDRLLGDAHERGLRVLLDWVPNHTSDRHPWFLASRSSRADPRRDWYVWRDGRGDQPPNNWTRAFDGGPAWTWDEPTGQWYLHLFLPQQPDLNWGHGEVVEAMHDVLRFWLDRGVDGFRADVVHLIGKDPELPDDPPHRVGLARPGFHDEPRTHELLRGIRGVLDAYPGERAMVGEINLDDPAAIVGYHGAGDQLHLSFNFAPLGQPWEAAGWRRAIAEVEHHYRGDHAWPTWVLSNHDTPRHRTRYGGSEARARAAAVLLLTLRGTPFLYAGEELGLDDASVPPEQRVDPGGRDGCRAPIPWEPGAGHGWPTADPWLPWPPEPATRNAERLAADPGSILHRYRALLAARRASPALHRGDLRLWEVSDDVVAYERAADGDRRVVMVNFADEPRAVPLEGGWIVEVASDGRGEGERYGGELAAEQAVLLR